MSMDFSGEGTYVCSLDDDTQKKAKKELNEDPKERASQIETLRKWLKQQAHLKCRTDDDFLLRFLRRSKFSQLLSQDLIENFVKTRCSPTYGVTEWLKGNNTKNEDMIRMMNLGLNVPLPGRDKNGRKVVLIRVGGAEPKDFENSMRIGYMTMDILLRDEVFQINGVAVLLDFTGFSKAHVLYWGRENVQKAMRCWQDVYPIRTKSINYYKTPTIFNVVFEIIKLFMKQKIKDRVHFHKNDLKSLHREIPKEMLPEEYGGGAGPLKKIIDDWKDYVIKNADEFDLLEKLDFDESKMPKKEDYGGDDGWGMTGSFRKLAVD